MKQVSILVPTAGAASKAKLRKSCDSCAWLKRRCIQEGKGPCLHCSKIGRTCVHSGRKKTVYKSPQGGASRLAYEDNGNSSPAGYDPSAGYDGSDRGGSSEGQGEQYPPPSPRLPESDALTGNAERTEETIAENGSEEDPRNSVVAVAALLAMSGIVGGGRVEQLESAVQEWREDGDGDEGSDSDGSVGESKTSPPGPIAADFTAFIPRIHGAPEEDNGEGVQHHFLSSSVRELVNTQMQSDAVVPAADDGATSPSSTSSKRKTGSSKQRRSCDSCSNLKRKCNTTGQEPCRECVRFGRVCVYSERKPPTRRNPAHGQLMSLYAASNASSSLAGASSRSTEGSESDNGDNFEEEQVQNYERPIDNSASGTGNEGTDGDSSTSADSHPSNDNAETKDTPFNDNASNASNNAANNPVVSDTRPLATAHVSQPIPGVILRDVGLGKLRKACDSCTRLKRRCISEGKQSPCHDCRKHKRQCIYSGRKNANGMVPPSVNGLSLLAPTSTAGSAVAALLEAATRHQSLEWRSDQQTTFGRPTPAPSRTAGQHTHNMYAHPGYDGNHHMPNSYIGGPGNPHPSSSNGSSPNLTSQNPSHNPNHMVKSGSFSGSENGSLKRPAPDDSTVREPPVDYKRQAVQAMPHWGWAGERYPGQAMMNVNGVVTPVYCGPMPPMGAIPMCAGNERYAHAHPQGVGNGNPADMGGMYVVSSVPMQMPMHPRPVQIPIPPLNNEQGGTQSSQRPTQQSRATLPGINTLGAVSGGDARGVQQGGEPARGYYNHGVMGYSLW